MSSSPMRWRILVNNIDVKLCIGIYEHEKIAQRVFISAQIECDYSANPEKIEDCFNYDHVYQKVNTWQQRPQTQLIETYVVELLTHIFNIDTCVTQATVSIRKPDIHHNAESVGVEATWTRADFERFSPQK